MKYLKTYEHYQKSANVPSTEMVYWYEYGHMNHLFFDSEENPEKHLPSHVLGWVRKSDYWYNIDHEEVVEFIVKFLNNEKCSIKMPAYPENSDNSTAILSYKDSNYAPIGSENKLIFTLFGDIWENAPLDEVKRLFHFALKECIRDFPEKYKKLKYIIEGDKLGLI